MKRSLITLLMVLGWITALVNAAEPTKEMRWKYSKTGKSFSAMAESLDDDVVTFVLRNGKTLEVKLKELSAKDRSFLTKHFAEKDEPNQKGPVKALPVEKGDVVGPIEASHGTKYYVYVPESLKQKQRVSLLFVTAGNGGNGDDLDDYIDYAEMYGWILAVSKEARKGNKRHVNIDHVSKCVNHLTRTLPIDKKRIYLAGHGDGGVIAIEASEVVGTEGVITNNAYAMQKGKPIGKLYYFMGGATSPLRYATAASRTRFGANGYHVFHTEGGKKPDEEFYYDAMYWMHIRQIGESKSRNAIEAELFEKNSLEFIEDNLQGDSHRAYWKAMLMKKFYKLSDEKDEKLDKMIEELEKDEANKLYVKGLEDLDDLSRKTISVRGYFKKGNYVDVKLQRASERLLKKYKDIIYVTEALEDFKKATK